MTWSASVIHSEKIDGFVNVTVQYTEGVNTVIEVYKSFKPDIDWIPKTVRDKIERLDAVSLYTIADGSVTPADLTVIDIDKDLFRRRCHLLLVVKTMVDLGIVSADNEKLLALVNWIKNNFNEYFDTL